jgi:ATP-dependent helicase HrpB
MNRAPLPIDGQLSEIVQTALKAGALVLQAEPGAGKTTRVPAALLDRVDGEVWVAEPRRMAATLAARFVASERGEVPGQSVGYAVRFDEQSSARTRLRYLTDGLLLRRLVADPELRGVSAVVLDEVHERRLAGDLILGLLRRLRSSSRPDLKILAMSATVDADALARWLGEAPVLHAPGRAHPVTIEHAATLDSRPLEDQVASTVRRLCSEGLAGDVLVFLPGAAEIRRCAERLGSVAHEHDLCLRTLHGAMPVAEQERAIRPEPRRKVVLATNIAETSLTLPGVVAVIDSGLARVAGHAAWSGMPTLQVQRVAKSSAVQRAGRAGRVQAGHCVRLYTQHDFDSRPAFDKPEVQRTDLAEAVLQLAALELAPDADVWPSPPPPGGIEQAVALLDDLGALSGGRITDLGRQLLRLPLPPRLGRFVVEARRRGATSDACLIAAVLGERDLRQPSRLRQRPAHGTSDVLALRDALVELHRTGFSPQAAREEGLDLQAARQVQRVHQQLLDACRHLPAGPPPPPGIDDELLQAMLVAFPDRVAKRRAPRSDELLLSSGGVVRQAAGSEASEPDFLVVVDAEERRDGRQTVTQVRLASGIEPTWLLELCPDRVTSEVELSLHGKRVVERERLLYRGLCIDEGTRPAKASPAVAAFLRAQLQLADVADPEAIQALTDRVAFCRSQGLELPEMDVESALAQLLATAVSLAELGDLDLPAMLRSQLGDGVRQLDQWAPEWLTLPRGRRARVHYAAGQTPWVSSRLQDFFGLTAGPTLAQGRVAAVLHLLAPNQRPVQVTSDLAGFWQRHYPALRKELGRRYPKHAWPEDPLRG